MVEVFPTPAAAIAALTRAGWEQRPADELVNNEAGTVAALVAIELPDHSIGCAPRLVRVIRRDDGLLDLVGAITGNVVEGWAVETPLDPENRKPLLMWTDKHVQPPAGDPVHNEVRLHDGMPDDPFGETPELAAHATDAAELMLVLKQYEAAGFTRAEAFKLVETIHQVELDHSAQHCLLIHQHALEVGDDELGTDEDGTG